MDFKKLYINGSWVEGASGTYIGVENPATEQIFAEVPAGTATDVERASKAAQVAFAYWKNIPVSERMAYMQRMLDIFTTMKADLVQVTIQELGAPVQFARTAQIEYQFTRIQSYIDLAEKAPLEEKLPQSTVYREPVGVVGCITCLLYTSPSPRD